MVKIDVDALVKELDKERERQLFFIECTKKEIAHIDACIAAHPERKGYLERKAHCEERLNYKLEKVEKLTCAIKMIETL